MHGIIFAEFQKFAETTLGSEAWARMTADAGLAGKRYLTSATYPDEELVRLVASAEKVSTVPAQRLLLQYGEFIVPDLIKVFGAFVKTSWGAMDILERTETVIHRAVRLRDPHATPPELKISRPHTNEVIIHYASARRLCSVAKGIIKGIGKHYQESLTVEEQGCMLTGGAECTLRVRRL